MRKPHLELDTISGKSEVQRELLQLCASNRKSSQLRSSGGNGQFERLNLLARLQVYLQAIERASQRHVNELEGSDRSLDWLSEDSLQEHLVQIDIDDARVEKRSTEEKTESLEPSNLGPRSR